MGGQDGSVNGEQSKPGGGGGEYPAPPTVPSLPPGVPPPPGVSASSVGGGNMYGEVVVDANANTAMDKYLQVSSRTRMVLSFFRLPILNVDIHSAWEIRVSSYKGH